MGIIFKYSQKMRLKEWLLKQEVPSACFNNISSKKNIYVFL